jgi:MFS family permease
MLFFGERALHKQAEFAQVSWVWVLVLFSIASFVETLFWGQMSAFTPLYLPYLGISQADVPRWIGIIVSISGVFGLPFLPFWGALADRYARQPIIIRSYVVEMLAGALTILAGNIWVFAIGRIVMSLALGNSGLMLTTLAEYAPQRRHGLAFAIMNSAGPIGIFIGPLLGGPVVDRWGFQTLLGVNVILLLAVVLALSFGYRDHYQGTNRGSLMRMAVDSVGIILRSPRLRLLFPALFLLFAGWMLAYTYVPLAITSLYTGNTPGEVVGLILGSGGLVALVISPLFGALADRAGHWRVLIAGAVLGVFLWPVPALVKGLVSFGVAWSVISGLFSGVFAISFSVLANSASADIRGRVMSFAYLPINVGYILGPAIGSVITKTSIFSIFPAAAVITALGILTMVLSYRQK